MSRLISTATTTDRSLSGPKSIVLLCLLLHPLAIVHAQGPEKQFEAVFTHSAPLIDGVLDDGVWDDAIIIDDFHEAEPIEFAPAKDATQVRFLYDEENIYVAAEITMRDASDITAFRLAQGSDIQEEDRFKVIIDPYNNGRSGYDFRINPNGVREEALFGLLGRPNADWNGIWDGDAKIGATGWTAEVAIPFKTLNFDPENSTWGISFTSRIPAYNVKNAWTSQAGLTRPGILGVVTGIDRARQGRGLDIVPSLTLRQSKDRAMGSDEFDFEPSLDIFYKLTPLLTAALTLNTDFSAAEVDDRVINLERFPVFFPEKRGFFLQDADIFSFAGLEDNGIPFFSRRIGLDEDRQPVDILGGAKLTGRIGPANVGILDVVQDAGTEDVNLFVGRGFLNVFNLSTLGLIYTYGSPNPDVSNSVAGIDFNYINRDIFGGKSLQTSMWYLQSDTSGETSSEESYGFRAGTSRNRGLFAELGYQRIGKNYIPALGFVNRSGIRNHEFDVGYRLLPDGRFLQSFEMSLEIQHVTDLDGNTESQQIEFEPMQFGTQSDDNATFKIIREREVLTAPFEIFDGVIIESGDYSWNSAEIGIYTGEQRALALEGTLAKGDFYDGDRLQIQADLIWQPSKYFSLTTGIEYNDIELTAGSFITRLLTMRTDISFSSSWSWNTLAQYDNESDELAINSRLRWIPKAGQEMIFVVNHGYLVDESLPSSGRSWRSLETDVVLKANYTFRY
jgi:hypothetical protein